MEVQWNSLHTRLIQQPTQVKFILISVDILSPVTIRPFLSAKSYQYPMFRSLYSDLKSGDLCHYVSYCPDG